jgi:hypothetical protein
MPLSNAQRQAIQERRDLLSSQHESASSRRDEIAEALKTAGGADRAGLEQRLIQIDKRLVQIEIDLAETGRLLTAAPVTDGGSGLFSSTETAPQFPPFPGEFGDGPSRGSTAFSILFTLFVLAPMAIAAARLMWKRAIAPRPPAPSPDSTHRLERMEQAIEAIAVEVERISEGQRFVTRILTESPAQAQLNAAQRQAEPLGVPRREGARVPREEL